MVSSVEFSRDILLSLYLSVVKGDAIYPWCCPAHCMGFGGICELVHMYLYHYATSNNKYPTPWNLALSQGLFPALFNCMKKCNRKKAGNKPAVWNRCVNAQH